MKRSPEGGPAAASRMPQRPVRRQSPGNWRLNMTESNLLGELRMAKCEAVGVPSSRFALRYSPA
jgi:hypothetical protein